MVTKAQSKILNHLNEDVKDVQSIYSLFSYYNPTASERCVGAMLKRMVHKKMIVRTKKGFYRKAKLSDFETEKEANDEQHTLTLF